MSSVIHYGPHPILVPWLRKSRAVSLPPYGPTACTEPQCLYKCALYLFTFLPLYVMADTRWHKKTGTSEMRSGSHVQLAALRNRDLELQTTSLKRQVVMVQFLSIKFFCWISSIFVGFFKSSRFFVSPCTSGGAPLMVYSTTSKLAYSLVSP